MATHQFDREDDGARRKRRKRQEPPLEPKYRYDRFNGRQRKYLEGLDGHADVYGDVHMDSYCHELPKGIAEEERRRRYVQGRWNKRRRERQNRRFFQETFPYLQDDTDRHLILLALERGLAHLRRATLKELVAYLAEQQCPLKKSAINIRLRNAGGTTILQYRVFRILPKENWAAFASITNRRLRTLRAKKILKRNGR